MWTEAVAFSRDGLRAFVANIFSDDVSVIDTTSNTVVATIPVLDGPSEVHVTPDGCLAFVTNILTDNPDLVSVIDISTSSIIATIPTFTFANIPGVDNTALALTPDSERAYLIETPMVQTEAVISVIDISDLCPSWPTGSHMVTWRVCRP